MRKRFLSAFLVLAMLFSLVPTSFAQTLDSSGAVEGSPNVITDINVKFEGGVLKTFTVTTGTEHNSNTNLFALIYSPVSYYYIEEDEDPEEKSDTYNIGHLYSWVKTGRNATSAQYSMPVYHFTTGNINQSGKTVDFMLDGVRDDNTEKEFTAASIEEEIYKTTTTRFAANDEIPIKIVIISNHTTQKTEANAFVYETTIKLNGDLTIPESAATPTPSATGNTISAFTVDLPKIALGSNVTTPAMASASSDVTLTAGTIQYDGNTSAPVIDLGTDYAITFSVTPTSSDDKFNTAANALVPTLNTTGGSYKSGYSPTIAVSNVTDSSADVTITIPKILIDDVTISPTTALSKTYTSSSPSYTITSADKSAISAAVEYNYDSTPITVDYASITGSTPSWISLNGTNCSLSGDTVSISADGASLKVDVANTYLSTEFSGATSKTVMTFNQTTTPVASGTINLTYPVPGAAPVTSATVTSSTELKIAPDGSNDVVWTDKNGNAVTGNFQYGEKYTATVEIEPQSGYSLTNSTTIDFADATVGSSEANVTPTKDSSTYSYSYEWTLPALTITGGGDLDYYNNYATSTDASQQVTVTGIAGSATISKVYLNGVELTSGYTIGTGADANKITISAAAMPTALNGAAETGLPSAASTATKWKVKAVLSDGGEAEGDLIQPYNSTPYMTLTQPTAGTGTGAGTLTLNKGGSAVSAVDTSYYPLVKGATDYTLDVSSSAAHIINYSYTGTTTALIGTASTTNQQTLAAIPTTAGARYDGKATVNVDTGKELTVSATNGTSVTVTDNTNSTTLSPTSGKYTIYAGDSYTISVTPNTHYHWNGSGDTPTDPWTLTSGTISGTAAIATSTGATAGTYTFTADGAGNVTVTANISEDASSTLTLSTTGYNSTKGDSYAVKDSGGTALTEISSGSKTYKVYDGATYTVEATAGTGRKITVLTGATLSNSSHTQTASTGAISGDKTVNITYADKTAPTLEDDPTTPGYKAMTKGSSSSTAAYSTYAANDYSNGTVVKLNNVTLTSGTDYTISGGTFTLLNNALTTANVNASTTPYNLVLTFTAPDGDTYDITRKIRVRGAATLTGAQIIDNDKYVHGDKLFDTGHNLALTVDQDGTSTTYTYTAATGAWDKDPASDGLIVNVTPTRNGTTGSVQTLTDFLNDAAKYDMYYSTYTGSNTAEAFKNGDSLAFALGTGDTKSVALTVKQKELTITLPTADIDKTYDQSATVTVPTATAIDSSVWSDNVQLTDLTITGKYRNDADNADDANVKITSGSVAAKTIKFTAVSAGTNDNAANYTFKIANGQGKINPIELDVTIASVPNATQGDSSYTTGKTETVNSLGNAAVTTGAYVSSASPDQIVSGDTVNFTYFYKYTSVASPSTSAAVTVETNPSAATNAPTISNTNYKLKSVTWSGTGTVEAKTVTGIALTVPSDHYYYGQSTNKTATRPTTITDDYHLVLIDGEHSNNTAYVTLTYSDSTTEDFFYQADGSWQNAGGTVSFTSAQITLTWDDQAKATVAPAQGLRLSPIEHNNNKLVATYVATGAYDKATITVDKKAITYTPTVASTPGHSPDAGKAVTKVYDGSDAVETGTGTTPTDATFTYALTNSDRVLISGTTYDDVDFATAPVSAVKFDSADVASATKISFTPATTALTGAHAGNYTVTFADLDANIVARPVKLTGIENITHVDQYDSANGTKTGLTATNATSGVNRATFTNTGDADVSGPVTGDTISFNFNYDYNYNNHVDDTAPVMTSGENNGNVRISAVTPVFTQAAASTTATSDGKPESINTNYTIEVDATPTYYGYLDPLTFSGITLSLAKSSYTYVTDETFHIYEASPAAYTTVDVTYGTGASAKVYYYRVADNSGTLQWFRQNGANWDAVSSVPFELRWNNAASGTAVALNNTTALTHTGASANVPTVKDAVTYKGTIYAVHNDDATAAKAASADVEIVKKPISKIELSWADGVADADKKIEKTYDKTDYLLSSDRQKLKLTAYYRDASNNDVAITGTDTEVNALIKYNSAAASTYTGATANVDKTLAFSNIALTKDDTGKFDLPSNIAITNSPEIKGTILKRNVTLTSIRHITPVSQNSAHTAWTSGSAASDDTPAPSGMYAQFAEQADSVVTTNGEATYTYLDSQTTTGRITSATLGNDTINIDFEYQYNDTSTVKETGNHVKDNNANAEYGNETVNFRNIVIGTAGASNNYILNATLPTSANEGTVTGVVPITIDITHEPDQFVATGATSSLQYGDKLLLKENTTDGISPLEVTVGYAPNKTDTTATGTKVFTYDPDNKAAADDVWTDGTARYTTAQLPFALTWGTTYGTSIEDGAVLNPTATAGVHLVATLTSTSSSQASDTSTNVLKVGKRQITVTPAAISKVYDGETTLSATGIAAMTYTVAFKDTGFTGLTEPTLDSTNTSVTSVTFQTSSNNATKHTTKTDGATPPNITQGAAKAKIAGFALTGTVNDNFEIASGDFTDTVSATITPRDVTLNELHFASVNQFASVSAADLLLPVNTTAAEPYAVLAAADTTTGVVAADAADFKVKANWVYTDTDTAGVINAEAQNVSTGITVNSVDYELKDGSTDYRDYNFITTTYTKYGEVTEQGHTIKIEHDAHHYDGSQTSGDTLDLLGTKVTVNNDVYTAVALATPETGKVRWQKNSDTVNYITNAADLPFTLSIGSTTIDAFDTSSTKLTVKDYNGAYIKAEHTYTPTGGTATTIDDIDDDTYAAPNTSHALVVNKIKIVKISAAVKGGEEIIKQYDNDDALGTDASSNSNAAKIEYTYYINDSGTETAITDTTAINTLNTNLNVTPKFASTDANADTTASHALLTGKSLINIVYDSSDPTLTTNDEYELATVGFAFVTTAMNGVGKITQMPLTVTNVYVPSTGKQASEPAADVKTAAQTVAAADVLTTGTPTSTHQVVINTALPNSDTNVTFKYAIEYKKEDVDTAETYNVTLVDNAVYNSDGTTPNTNYVVDWTQLPTLQGDVIAATLEKIELKKTSATKTSGYTHGDALDLTGLELVIYTLPFDKQGTTDYTTESYKVAKDGAIYKWVDGSGNNVTIPSYVQQLQIAGSGSTHDLRAVTQITTPTTYDYYWELNNNAHYLDMNGAKITAQVAMGGVTKTATLKDGSDGTTGNDLTIGVSQKALSNATVNVSGSAYTPMSISVNPTSYKDILTKYYDTTAAMPAGVTITVSPDSDELQVFNTSAANNKALSTADKDTVSMKYASAAYVKDTAANDADVEIDTPASGGNPAVYGKDFVVKDIELNNTDDYQNYTFTKQDETLTGAILPYKLKITALPDADDAILNDATTATKDVKTNATTGITNYTANIDSETNAALVAAKPAVTYTYNYDTKINTPGTYNDVTILDGSSNSTLAFLPATNNFEFDPTSTTVVNGEVTKKKIVKIDVTLPEEYKYGDKLDIDDVTIKVWYDLSGTNEGTDFISNIKYADDNWKNLALALSGTNLTAGQLPTADLTQAAGSRVTDPTDILKWVDTSTAANKMYVVVSTTDQDYTATGGTDENVSGQAEVVVNKRKILIQPKYSAIADHALVKKYDTTPYFKINNVPTNSDINFPLEVVADITGRTDSVLYNASTNPSGVKIDGLQTGDTDISIANIPFKLKNTTDIDANYSVLEAKTGWTSGYTGDGYPAEPMTTSYNITGTNADQYEAYMADVEGWVKPREIALRPVVSITVPPTETRNIDETVTFSDKDKKINITGPQNITIFDRDKTNLSFNYKLTLPEADIANGTVTQQTKAYNIAEATADDGGYKHSETGSAANNYSFTWQPAIIQITNNAPAAIKITHAAKEHMYGDTAIDLDDVEVQVIYDDGTYNSTDGTGGVVKNYDKTNMPSDITFKLNGVVIDSTTGALTGRTMADAPLTTADSGTLTAEIPDGFGGTLSSNGEETAASVFTVNKRPITIKFSGESYTKTYNGNENADAGLNIDTSAGHNNLYTTDTINYNSPKFYYYASSPTDTSAGDKTRHVDEAQSVRVEGFSPKITSTTGADVTDQYEITGPAAVAGSITAKTVKVTADTVSPVTFGETDTTKLTVTAVPKYTDDLYDVDKADNVYVELNATYTASDVTDPAKKNTQVDVTLGDDPLVEHNNDHGDYVFQLDPATAKGMILDPIISEIAVTAPDKVAYVHGDRLDLTNMMVTVKYKENNVAAPQYDKTYTYTAADTWTPSNDGHDIVKTNSSYTDRATYTTKQLADEIGINISLVTALGQKSAILKPDVQLRYNVYKNAGKINVAAGTATERNVDLTVTQKTIDDVSVAYAEKSAGIDYTAKDIKKQYDSTVDVLQQNAFKYASTDIVAFDNIEADGVTVNGTTTDDVTIKAVAEYNNKTANAPYNATDAQLTDSKTFTYKTYTIEGPDAVNYTLAADNAITQTGTVNGNITKAPLTITMTNVPSVQVGATGADLTVTLQKDATNNDYNVSGLQSNDSAITFTVTAKYDNADSITTANGATMDIAYTDAASVVASDPTTIADNYELTLNRLNGTVTAKAVDGIEIITGPKNPNEHGDQFRFNEMLFHVQYKDGDNKYFKYSQDADDPYDPAKNGWTISDTQNGTYAPTTLAANDLVIVWGLPASTTEVEQGAKLRLDNLPQGFTDSDGDGDYTGRITVRTTSNSANAYTPVNVNKKQLKLVVKGHAEKIYNGDALLQTDSTRTYTDTTKNFTFYFDGIDGSDTLAVDEAASLANNVVGYVTKTSNSERNQDAAEKDISVATANIVTTDTDGSTAYYKLPSTAADVTNTATGEIKKRTLTITGVKDGTVSIKNDDNSKKTGSVAADKTVGIGRDVYTWDSSDSKNGLFSTEDVKVNIDYAFTVDPTDVTATTNDAAVNYTADATTPVVDPDDAPARNYIVTFNLAPGKGTIAAESLTSIAITTGPTKAQTTEDAYEYKDKVQLAGTVITLTYDNDDNKTEVYTYNAAATDGNRWNLVSYKDPGTTVATTLPAEITLSFDRTSGTAVLPNVDPANQNRVVMEDNGTHLKAVHSDIATPAVSTETYYVKKRVITVTTANKENTPYEKTYNKSNAISAAEVTAKLDITNDLAAVLAAADETDRFALVAATDITATIGDANGNVKLKADNVTVDDQQEIKLNQTAYTLPAVDAGGTPDATIAQQYEITYVDNAKGKIAPKEIAVNIFAPSIEQDLTGTESKRTVSPTGVSKTASASKGYFTAPLLEENDEITIQYTAKYNDPTKVSAADYDADLTITADTLKIDGGAAQNNYVITSSTIKGTVTSPSSMTIRVSKQPDKGNYKSGETLDLTGMQVTIDGIANPIDYDPADPNSEWNKLGLSIEPADTQDGATLSVGSNGTDSIHVVRGTGANKETASGTIDITTTPRTIKVSADEISKIYDGKSDAPVTLKIADDQTGFDGFRAGTTDAATAVIAPAAMTDNYKFVDKTSGADVVDASTDAYKVVAKDASKIVLSDATLAKEYTLVVDDLEGKINKRPLKIEITAPSKTVKANATDADKALDLTGVTLTSVSSKGKYALAEDSNSIVEGDTVTIAYKGAYNDISAQTGAGVAPVTVTQVSVDGTDKAPDNYTVEVTKSTGTVSSASTGGGGGGGSSNSLSIKYENEDGTAGKDVSKIEAQVGDDPTDLIGVFKARMTNQTVLWTSSNEKVATVDENGIVTYVGEGKATITATSQQSKSLKDTVEIVVSKATVTPAPEPTSNPSGGEATPTPKPNYTKTDSLITKEMLNPYIVGYDDYVFGPELPISREELSAIFARLIQNSIYMDQDYDTSFPDVPEKWSKSYIGFLEGYNVVTGYEDGTFRPENYITRAEMAVMMAKAEGYDLTGYVSPDEVPFPDVDEGYSTWAATKAIKILTDMGIMQGYPDGTFRPGQPITRAETVATVNRVLADMEVADYEVLPSDVTDAHWAYNDIVFAMNHRILKDAAADPQRFIWSEQFDENMIINTERAEGETVEVPASEEAGNASEETSSEETAGTEDAIAPEATEAPAEDTAQTTN